MAETTQTNSNDPSASAPNTSITTPDLLETPEESFDDVRPTNATGEASKSAA